MTSDQMWDDNTPMYRPNWRDRRDMRAAERLPEVANVHERPGMVEREVQPAENADQFPPHEIRRDA